MYVKQSLLLSLRRLICCVYRFRNKIDGAVQLGLYTVSISFLYIKQKVLREKPQVSEQHKENVGLS